MSALCTSGPQPATGEGLFLAELATVKAAVDAVRRRHRLSSQQAEDLTSEVYLKIMDDDYAVLRKFQGRSSLRTYLIVVVNRLYLDIRTREWGRWRPSAAARRHGRTGILFERLTIREGLRFDDACQALQIVYGVPPDRVSLAGLAGLLPPRVRRESVSAHVLEEIAAPDCDPCDAAFETSRQHVVEAMSRALGAEVASLSDGDRWLIRRRFVDGARLRDLAREIPLPPKAVYRRLERAIGRLRRRLERRGISRTDVADALRPPRLPANVAGR